MPVINKIQDFLRVKRGVTTPYRFWKDTGISRPVAYDLWNDPHKLPDPSAYAKICDRYEVQPSDFLSWVPDDTDAN